MMVKHTVDDFLDIQALMREHGVETMDAVENMRRLYALRDQIPNNVMALLVNDAIDTYDPWTAGLIVEMPWLCIALLQQGDHDQGMVQRYNCPCGTTYTNRKGFAKHFGHCEPATKESEKMEALVPTHPSNRRIIDQCLLHGCEIKKKKGDRWVLSFPGKTDTVEVLAPNVHDGNPTSTFLDIYRLLGITPQEFWAKTPTQDAEDAALDKAIEEATRKPISRGQSTQVLSILLGQNRPMTVSEMAEMSGLENGQVSRAFYYLSTLEPPLVRRLKQGIWEATKAKAPDHMVAIDVSVSNGDDKASPDTAPSAPLAASEPAPGVTHGQVILRPFEGPTEPVDTQVTDEEMDEMIVDFLDMIFPSGFSARHLRAIDHWRAATKALFKEMGK